MSPERQDPVGLFVYGTLRRDQSAFPVARDAGWVDARPAVVRGFHLYALPFGWPAAVVVPDAGVVVHGEIHTFRDLDSALAALDEYEEVDLEFHRIETVARPEAETSGSDTPVPVWIYCYPDLRTVGAVGGCRIPDGRWTGPDESPCHDR